MEKERLKNGGLDVPIDVVENKLPENIRRENVGHIQVFGEEFVVKAYSKKHSLRREAVEDLKLFLTQGKVQMSIL
jgi:predicted nucleotidyltransferase